MNNNIYEELAQRNNWDYSILDNRPYFMKNGDYATPDENTSDNDKLLLAKIISEGSDEMVNLILKCWDNNIKISGPCSGIKEFHDNPPYRVHFAFISSENIIKPLYEDLKSLFPNCYHLYRDNNVEKIRYDFDYGFGNKELTKEEVDGIFKLINEHLDLVLQAKQNDNEKTIN